MSDNSDSGADPNRRNVLRTVGAAGAALAGFTGTSGASDAPRPHVQAADGDEVRAYETYATDETKVERAYDEYATELAEAHGVALPDSVDAAEELTVFPTTVDGQPTAHVVARFDDDREVLVHLYPQADRAYADVGGGEGTTRFALDGSRTTLGCYKSYDCDCPSACGWYMGYETVYNVCRFPDGTYKKERIGGHCDCDDAPNPCYTQ